jgi:hypothetical protein
VAKYARADQIARQLKPEPHFEVKEKEHSVALTEEGVRTAEKLAGVESFYTVGNMEWPHLIDNSLKAHHLDKRRQKGQAPFADTTGASPCHCGSRQARLGEQRVFGGRFSCGLRSIDRDVPRGPPTDWGELVQVHFRPGNLSSDGSTGCPRSTSTASDRHRTRGVEAPGTAGWDAVCTDARKTPPKRVRGVSRNPLRTPGPLLPRLTSRSSAGRPVRKCH